MTSPQSHPARPGSARRLRWAVPAVALVAVAGAVALPQLATADPADLAPRSAAQLLVDLSQNRTSSLSGTVVQTSRLGLPELPGAAARTTGPLSLASGSNTLRVWADGPDRSRVALMGQLAEYDVVRSGRDVWTYSSQRNEAVHYTLPRDAASPGHPGEPGRAVAKAGHTLRDPMAPGQMLPGAMLPSTPAAAADAVLALVDPSTSVTVEENVTVAGRGARQLVLTPRDSSSLMGSVRLAVDAETSTPLRVQVFAAADRERPAFEVGFTNVTFAAPKASVFAFTAPPGARTREVTVPAMARHGKTTVGSAKDLPAGKGSGARPTIVGEGWTSIVALEGIDVTALAEAQPELLTQLTTRVPEGRVLKTALLTVLITDDGRVLVGAVPVEALRAAA